MQKLPTFNSCEHEFIFFATVTLKNAMAIKEIGNRLNKYAEAINQLIDRDPSIDLQAFKSQFLSDLAELLLETDSNGHGEADSSTTEILELESRVDALELQLQAAKESLTRLESIFPVDKFEKSDISDLLI